MKFRKTPAAQAEIVDDSLVVMNTATMKCFLMNDIAAVLWDAMDHYPDRDSLVAILREAANADPEMAVDTMFDHLLECGLIERVT